MGKINKNIQGGKMKNISKFFVALMLVAFFMNLGFAGGLPEDDDLTRELAKAQNELEDQKNKADDLQDQVNVLRNTVDELAAREPSVIEKTITTLGSGSSPINLYADSIYADSDALTSNGTFDQQAINITYTYKHEDSFVFYGDIGFYNGADVTVDMGEADGTGDFQVVEAWLDWRAIEDKLVLKFGKFFTPFGQWMPNEIAHSTVSVFNPLLVDWSIVPSETTGIQEYGMYDLGAIKLSQAFYVGNGKSSRPHSRDDNADKVFGGRLGVMLPFGDENSCVVGVSGYVGRDDRDGNDYQEKVFGLDARVDLGPVIFRAETIKSRVNADPILTTDEGHIWKAAWFTQVSYNFLEKFEVFYRHDFGDDNFREDNAGDIQIDSIGLSYRPVVPVVFKIEFDRYDVDDENVVDSNLDEYDITSAQVAVKF